MRADIWGPHAWIFLHSISLEYPDSPTKADKDNMRKFINSLGDVLPCKKCIINFKLHDKTLNDNVLSSKKNLVKWFIDVHNAVNKENNKPELTYDDALKHILVLYNNNNKNNIMVGYFLVVLIVIIIMSFLLYRSSV
jgi:hypothetical protein